MKAAVLRKPKSDLEFEDREVPAPGAGQVLIRVAACGVCHSDLHLREGDFPFARYPVVPGHEVAGTIEATGDGVDWPQEGTKVGLPWLYSSCGRCTQCLRGEEGFCEQHHITGATKDGGYQQYMLAAADYVAPLPENLGFAESAPMMCAGLTMFNGLRNAGFKAGDKVAVIGLGGLGHLGVLFARAMGGRVAVLSSTAEKESEALELGAERFINTQRESASKALQAWEGGADIILSTAPTVGPPTDAFPGLAPDGTLVILGVGAGTVSVTPADLIGGRRRVMGSPSGSRKDLRKALEFAANNGVRPRVTSFPFERANEVLADLKERRLRDRAVLVFD